MGKCDRFFFFKVNSTLVFSLCVLSALLIFAIAGPYLALHSYDETNLAFKNLSPDSRFWFGTDELGRDLFTRCCVGARISLIVAFAATFIDLVLGVSYGMISGYGSQKMDEWMMSFIDILQSIPYLLIVILLIVLMGPGLITVICALAITGWMNMARIVRGQVLQLKNQEFVIAAEAYGASKSRIIIRHLLPNVRGQIIVVLMAGISTALFTEAFLSFLGLGVQAPVASWGTLANDGLLALRYYPWRIFFPAFLICLTILSLNLIGDGLRDLFDERKKI